MTDATGEAHAVRRNWWEPEIDRARLKRLMQRSDGPGLAFFGFWLALLVATGAGIHFGYGTPWLVPAVILYGFVLGFAYAPSHECAHGTAFRTRWLNETVLWISSFIWGESPTHRRYAHSHHHTHTWHWQVDAQMGYRNPVKLRTYIGDIVGIVEFIPRLKLTVRHALGRIVARERVYVPAVAIPRMILEARILLAGYLALLAWAAIGQTWAPFLYFFVPRFAGAFGVFLFITTQHMAMNQDVNDHRENSRSMRNGWLARVLYWNMNYHIEHHVYPSVPFHALPALNEAIRNQLPEPCPGLFAAHREILGTLLEQRRDPSAFVRRPIPDRAPSEGASRAAA